MVSGYLGGENVGGVCVCGNIPVERHFCLYWNGLWKEELCRVFMFALFKNYSVACNSSQPNAKQNKVKPQTLNHKNDISNSVNFVAYGSRLGQNIKHGILFFQMEAHTKAFNVSVVNVYTQILIVYI